MNDHRSNNNKSNRDNWGFHSYKKCYNPSVNIYSVTEMIDDQVREVDDQFCELERNLSTQFEKCRCSESVATSRVFENTFSEYLFVRRN